MHISEFWKGVLCCLGVELFIALILYGIFWYMMSFFSQG